MEASYRYSKLYPKEAKDFTKRASDSPFVEKNKFREFSDYLLKEGKGEEYVKDFAAIIQEDIKEDSPSPFKRAKNRIRSSSVGITRPSANLEIGYGENLPHKIIHTKKEGLEKIEQPNFIQTFKPRKLGKLDKLNNEASLIPKNVVVSKGVNSKPVSSNIKKQGIFMQD